MPRRIAIAALQMDASPAPSHERLAIADRLVNEAHDKGAQLVVLPEVFNTGYGYTDANYERTETLDGPTVTWMKETALDLLTRSASATRSSRSSNGNLRYR